MVYPIYPHRSSLAQHVRLGIHVPAGCLDQAGASCLQFTRRIAGLQDQSEILPIHESEQ